MKKTLYLLSFLSIIFCLTFSSCKKLNYESNFVTFGEVYFQNQSVLNNDLGVKFKGEPIDWQMGTGKIRVPEGEHTFVFYDKRTDEVLAERTINIISGSPERFLLFQPLEEAPLAFLDPNGQDNEDPAPEGYFKVKVANMSQFAVPDDVVHLVVNSTIINPITFGPIDTLKNIGKNLEDQSYFLVKKAYWNGREQSRYKFSFLKAETEKPILNYGGTTFMPAGEFTVRSATEPKGLYTVYITDLERENPNDSAKPVLIFRNDKYWTTSVDVLYKD